MKRKMRILGLILSAGALLSMMCMTGCSDGTKGAAEVSAEVTAEATETATPEPTPEESPTEEPSAEPSYVSYGKESEDAYKVLLTNGTEQDIKELKTRNSDDSEFGDNVIPSNTSVRPDETFRLYVERKSASAEPSEAAEGGDAADGREIAFNETYDISLTFADGKEAVLYDLGLDDIKEAVILFSVEADVAYVSYVSTATEQTVSTLDAQIARSRDEAAAALEATAASDAPAPRTTGGDKTAQTGGEGGNKPAQTADKTNEAAGNEAPAQAAAEVVDTPQQTIDDTEIGPGDDGLEQDIGECIEDNVVWND